LVLLEQIPYFSTYKHKHKYKVMEQIKPRIRRSEIMTKEEHRAFEKWVKSFPTQLDAADVLGYSRVTLMNVVIKGSGKPETIQRIREVIKQTY
jgi:hypothetical protein